MAPRKSRRRIVAKIVTGDTAPCGFCQRQVDDELTYGKLYAIGDIQCHYFCVLLSSCLVQKGRDEDGLFGFVYEDIVSEIERAKKHRCSFCSRGGANLGCSVSQCRKQFHLPCGRERNAVSLFYGNYKSFCQLHAPKQNIPACIMAKAKFRMASNRKAKNQSNFKDLKELSTSNCGDEATQKDAQSVCVICYEDVEGYPTVNTFWPPCCARDAWFHRNCLQRMALSAGMHYLKCPLCNDKENFYQAVVSQGYYVPDRDAAWELEQNAFAEIYDREVLCSADDCQCPMGRSHDADQGAWCVKLCLLCGSSGVHGGCVRAVHSVHSVHSERAVHVCTVCTSAAPTHIDTLASAIQQVIIREQEEQASTSRRRGPVMPARMSLRRTKRVTNSNSPSSSSSGQLTVKTETRPETPTNSASSREDLNLKPPKKPKEEPIEPIKKELDKPGKENYPSPLILDFKTHSPSKILEESLNKIGGNVAMNEKLVNDLRRQFKKPKPLSEKRKIVNEILNGMFDHLLKDPKQKTPVKQWCSPKKTDITSEVIVLDDTPPSKTERDTCSIKKEQESETVFSTPKKATPGKYNSDITTCNYPIFNTPKKLKTVDIEKDSSLEISAEDEIINIDVIKLDNAENDDFLKALELNIPEKSKKCAFKFRDNKEVLKNENIDIDLESFKDRYLNEVGLQRKMITATNKTEKSKKKNRKRKLEDDNFLLKYESKKRKKQRKNISIKDKNIKVKIKWRKEQLKLKITDSKKKKKKNKKFKQYVLEYSPKTMSSITKPTVDVTPMKRKKQVKQEKTPDNLVQTSIQKFFKVKTPSKD